MNKATILIEQNGPALRIVIPMGRGQRLWLLLAATVILLFGVMMSVVAAVSLRHTHIAGGLWWTPLIFTALVVLCYIVSLAVISAIPTSIISFDGKTLAVGDTFDERRMIWARQSVKSIRVSRLPMVPIATMIIRPDADAPVRAGYWRNREMIAAANRLKSAMGMR